MKTSALTESSPGRGLYLYCVVARADAVSFACRGLRDGAVRTVARGDLSAVVEDCAATAFFSPARDEVERWLRAHERVVEASWRRFGSVLPCTFNTIVRASGGRSAAQNLAAWLGENRKDLRAEIERLRGRAEYGVQIFWEPDRVSRRIAAEEPEIARLQEEAETSSPGIAYLSRERLKKRLRRAVEARGDALYERFWRHIRGGVEAVKVARLHEQPGQTMLMNLACLLPQGDEARLGSLLDEIAGVDGCSVRFTGPWPPYSFVESVRQ